MKYFCVSDIHGYYDVLLSSLKKHGYDEMNHDHKLIVIGDMTDRGPQAKETLEYIYKLHSNDKAIVLLGNHDVFLRNFLQENFERTRFDILKNGHKITLTSLLEHDFDEEDTDFIKESQELNEKYPFLKGFLEELALFYELEDYIFVHGGIDVSLDDWREDSIRNFTWSKQHTMRSIPGKTIIVGHTQAVRVRTDEKNLDQLFIRNPELFENLFGEGTIHIDGSVVTTQNINVLVLDI